LDWSDNAGGLAGHSTVSIAPFQKRQYILAIPPLRSEDLERLAFVIAPELIHLAIDFREDLVQCQRQFEYDRWRTRRLRIAAAKIAHLSVFRYVILSVLEFQLQVGAQERGFEVGDHSSLTSEAWTLLRVHSPPVPERSKRVLLT